MEIQKNSRQVPKTKELISQQHYSDVLYCHLQVISFKEEKDEKVVRRYVTKKMLNQGELAATLGVSRPTISKKLNKLKEMGLLVQEGDKFILTTLTKQEAFLLPVKTMRKMVNSMKDRTIDIYVYLLNNYLFNNSKPYEFSIIGIKDYCGLGIKTNNNNYIVTDILEILQRLGLIQYSVKKVKNELGQIKTQYILERASNTFEGDDDDSNKM